MTRITLAPVALGASALAAAPAMAENCATLAVSPGTPSIPTWNPINPGAQTATFVATITRKNGSSVNARLIFMDSNSSATPIRVQTTTGPRYEIVNTDNGATVSFPSGTAVESQTVPLTALANKATNVNLTVRILANSTPTEDFLGGASYSETLNYSIQCFKDKGSNDGIDSNVGSGLNVSLTIPKLISVTTGNSATIDFGNFTTSSEKAVIGVKSTSSLNVSVSTFNTGSQLLRTGATAASPLNMRIPYTMAFGLANTAGSTVSPGSPLTNFTRAGVGGTNYDMVLNLTGGVPSGKLAGVYTDTIILTIAAGL